MIRLSKTDQSIDNYKHLVLKSYILCVDPSTGSSSSLPGYAIYESGKLKESGVIQVPLGASKNKRLYEIRRTLQEEFKVPDILVIEHIQSVLFPGSKMNSDSLAGLQRGVGAILSAFNVDNVIEVSPVAWKRIIDEDYKKSDEADAVYMGKFVIHKAIELMGVKHERSPKNSREGYHGLLASSSEDAPPRASKNPKKRTRKLPQI